MKKQRKHDTPEEKVAILRRHLLGKEPISKLCDEVGLQPTVLYRWQISPSSVWRVLARPEVGGARKQRQIRRKQAARRIDRALLGVGVRRLNFRFAGNLLGN